MSLRDGPFQDLKVPLRWTAAVAVVVAIIIGLALVFGDRRETLQGHAAVATRGAFDRMARPVGGVLSAPVRWVSDAVGGIGDYFFAVSENRRLKQEVADLRHWRDEAIAYRHENDRYEALLGLKTEPPIPMVGARVIADVRGPFAQTRLADAGVEDGVREGNPVMNEHGLVGRILGVANGVSRILLLTDVSSRTPVMIDRTDARAVLTGDGSGSPTLEYLRGANPIKAGDRVLTSGDGGLFPRGLPVGVAYQGLDGSWRVRLDSDDGPIDPVRILLFRDFSQLANQPALRATTIPPLAPADAAAVAAEANAGSSSPAASSAHPAVSSHPAVSPRPPVSSAHPVATVAASSAHPAHPDSSARHPPPPASSAHPVTHAATASASTPAGAAP